VRTISDLECEVAELRLALYTGQSTPDEVVELRRLLHGAVTALSSARHPEQRREGYRCYRERHYRQQTARANETNCTTYTRDPSVMSRLRVPEPVWSSPDHLRGRCPRDGQLLMREPDGLGCLCGYHWISAARPLLLDGAAVPPTQVGRW